MGPAHGGLPGSGVQSRYTGRPAGMRASRPEVRRSPSICFHFDPLSPVNMWRRLTCAGVARGLSFSAARAAGRTEEDFCVYKNDLLETIKGKQIHIKILAIKQTNKQTNKR